MSATTAAETRSASPQTRSTAARPPQGGPVNGRRMRHWAQPRWYVPLLFVGLPLAIVLTITIFPFFNTVVLAFTDATMLRPGQFIGVENFIRLWEDPRFSRALFNSALYVVCVVPFTVVMPLILAALSTGKSRILGFFRTSYYLPVVLGAVAGGLIWTNLLDTQGLVNSLLGWLNVVSEPIPFLTDRWLLLGSAMIITVWMGMGYYMVIYLAALSNIDPTLYDAAAMDGAGPVRKFLSVTVPGVRSTMALIAMFSSVSAFRVFNEIYILTGGTGGPGGGATTLTMLIEREGTGLQAQTGYAGAISLVMFIVLAALLVLQLVVQNRQEKNG